VTGRWKETFLAWAETKDYKRRLEQAKTMIADATWRTTCYVAFSGGKDSTVLTHLVLQDLPTVMVLHWDYGRHYVPEPLHREIVANAHKLGVRNLRIETSDEYEKLGRKAVGVLAREMIRKLMPQLKEEGYNLTFVGLRKEESLKRRRRMRRREIISPLAECWPLENWTWMDVWAHIVNNELPYLSIYDRLCELVGYDKARFTTLFDPEFRHLGTEAVDNVLHWKWRNPT